MKRNAICFILLVIFLASAFPLTQATVSRVIDGDTIELTSGERVRFIGVDAPERGEAGANEATQFVRELVEGRTVWLEADGADRDRWGRLRRYVWLRQPTNPRDENEIRQFQLNALLLQAGHATVMIIGNVRNEALFRQLAGTPAQATRINFIGNRNSRIFHTAACNSLPAPQNRVNFETREEATGAGFRPCQRCRP